MQKSGTFLFVELTLLFVLIPCMLLLEIPVVIKAASVLSGIVYVIRIVVKNKLVTRHSLYTLRSISYWKYIIFRFVVLIVSTTLLMYFFNGEKLFLVVRRNIVFWLGLSLFYSTISVYPQEFLYRTFFFTRYGFLFKKPWVLIAVNAVLFSFAHVAFKNLLVLLLTLAGGVIFAITYSKTKSLLLTSIEHALYGSWLFTVGMGEMLAFPMPL